MRTNIVIDDDVVDEAMALSGAKTKREVVDRALREFVAHRKRLDPRALKGQDLLRPDHDHKALRAGRGRG